MDMTWIMDRVAVGGGIENAENMAEVARAGVTHIINMQIEFDDTELARPYGIKVLNNGVYNDFEPKPPELFERGVEFGSRALRKQNSKLLIHCTLGMHRAPTMTLALLCALGWPLPVARQLIERCRPVVYLCDNYICSVERFLKVREEVKGSQQPADPVSASL
jgi:protein-tyrosine phosphatase